MECLQDEECKDTFTKDCYIEYTNVPKSEQVEICVTPWQRDCDAPGEQDCTTEYETSKMFYLCHSPIVNLITIRLLLQSVRLFTTKMRLTMMSLIVSPK